MRHLHECKAASTENTFECDGCSKSFGTQKGLNRHIAWCERSDEIDLVKKMRRELKEEMRKELQKLAFTTAAAPAQMPTVVQNNGSGIGIGTNIGINTGIAITNNVMPWGPLRVDFERLKVIDPKFVPPSSVMDRSLIKPNPTESLIQDHMRLDPPQHQSVLATSEDWDGMRFFDGVAYRRMEDPKKGIDTRYQLCAVEQLQHLKQNIERVRKLCIWQDIDFDRQCEHVRNAPAKENRFDVILRRMVASSRELLEVAQTHQIAIDV